MRIGDAQRRTSRRGQSAPMAEINIIPLVDVILVLLIIFMVTTAFVKETGLNLKLPPAKTGEAGAQISRDLTIALGRQGEITLDGRAANEAQVATEMRARVARNRQTRVVIKGDAGIAYSRVIRMMDLARESGLTSVSLGTKPPEPGAVAR